MVNFKTISDIPKNIKFNDFPKNIEIRGEVYINKIDFEKLKEKFANPRNAASGSLRQKDSIETKKIPLKFIAYTFGLFENNNFDKQSDFLDYGVLILHQIFLHELQSFFCQQDSNRFQCIWITNLQILFFSLFIKELL